MMDGDACFQAGDGGMVLAQPFLAHLQGTRDRRFVFQQRVQIATLAEVHDLFAVALDPIGLGREDEGPLALACELPRREQS